MVAPILARDPAELTPEFGDELIAQSDTLDYGNAEQLLTWLTATCDYLIFRAERTDPTSELPHSMDSGLLQPDPRLDWVDQHLHSIYIQAFQEYERRFYDGTRQG